MLTVVRSTAVALVAGLIVVGSAAPATAHQQWFVHDAPAYPLDLAALLRPSVLIAVSVAVVMVIIWRAVATRLSVPELGMIKPTRRLAGMVPWTPRILAAHLGFSLLLLVFDGVVLDPGNPASDGLGGTVLLVLQAVVGVLLIAGVLVRAAALVVMITVAVVLLIYGLAPLGSLTLHLGVATFLFVLPRGRQDGRCADADLPGLLWATRGLKFGAGITLIFLAVVEKLANPGMARAMLDQVPALNPLAPLGVTSNVYVLFSGSVELALGLLIVSGALPQVVAIVTAVPFTATVALFGTTELLGHLPLYGLLLTFLILGSREDTSRTVSGLKPRNNLRPRNAGETISPS